MKKILMMVLSFAFIVSCGKETPKADSKKDSNSAKELTFDLAKKQKIGLQVCEITSQNMPMIINATGVLDVPPQNSISVSPQMAGFVKSTTMLQGMKVQKGQVIAVMQNQEYIQIQQDYLENKSQLEYLEGEYKRQEILSKDNINSQKVFAQAKANYQSTLARYSALKAKINMLGMNLKKIEDGEIFSTIDIKSEINGTIAEVFVNIGKFVNPNEVMFRIVNTEHIHAEIKVFEKDLANLQIGQEVSIRLGNENVDRKAEIHLIGKELSQDRTLMIHCHLDKEESSLIPGMFLKAMIHIPNKDVDVLPESAVVKYEGKNYVFIENESNNKFTYAMSEVKVGGSHDEMISLEKVYADNLRGKKIVSKGAYKLLSQEFNSND